MSAIIKKAETILSKDIERYVGYHEFLKDELYRCHPNDERRLVEINEAYEGVVCALIRLEGLV